MGASGDLEAWDRVARTYAEVVGQASDSIYSRFEPFLWRHVGDLSGLCLLDVGCGHGWLAELCRVRGATVVGVDGSGELLAIARARYPEVAFERADLTEGLPESVASQTKQPRWRLATVEKQKRPDPRASVHSLEVM